MDAVADQPTTPLKRHNGNTSPHDWMAIRADYLSGSDSIRTIATRHNVPYPTCRDAATRERWPRIRQDAHKRATNRIVTATCSARDVAARAVETTIAEVSAQSSLTAQRLIRESLDDSSAWLEHIRSTPKSTDAATIRAMVSAWSQVVGVGRAAHRLDDVAPVSVTIGMIVGPGPVAIEKAIIEVESE